MTMLKTFSLAGLLFGLGIFLGAMFTPVGVDWSKELVDPDAKVPVHRKQQSNGDLKSVYS